MKTFEEYEYPVLPMINIFVVLEYYYDGDSYLRNSYLDCFSSKRDAIECANKIVRENPINPKHNQFNTVDIRFAVYGDDINEYGFGGDGVSHVLILKKEF